MTTKNLDLRLALHDVFEGLNSEEEAMLMDAFAMSPALSPMLAPPARLKRRLMEAVERPRYAFLDRVARLLDLGREQARAALDLIDSPEAWEAAGQGCWLLHLTPGPTLTNAVVGLVRVQAGTRFPRHVHIGLERVLVLQGSLLDDSGRVSLPGDLVIMPPESAHDFEALPGDDLLYLAVVDEGVDFTPAGGGVILPRGRQG